MFYYNYIRKIIIYPNHISQKEGAKRAKEIKAHTYVECTSREARSVGKIVMEAVNIVLEADKARKIKNEKQFKVEKKQEEKEAKKMAKKKKEEEKEKPRRDSHDKGKQKEEPAPSST